MDTKKFLGELKMNTAKRFENRFNRALNLSSDEFYSWLALFRDELFLNGEVSIEESNSYDPSWNIVFSDGSKGYLGNPYQRAFEAFFYAC